MPYPDFRLNLGIFVDYQKYTLRRIFIVQFFLWPGFYFYSLGYFRCRDDRVTEERKMDDRNQEDLRRSYCFNRPIFYNYSDKEILVRNFKKFVIFLPVVLIFLILSSRSSVLAADIILKDLNGREVNLSSRNGKPAILFFWTTWCHFCRNEIKALNQNYNKIENEGITVFAINIGESGYRVQNFFKDYALNFRVLLDEDGLAGDKYNIVGVPTYIFLDKSGNVISSENRLPADYKSLLLKSNTSRL